MQIHINFTHTHTHKTNSLKTHKHTVTSQLSLTTHSLHTPTHNLTQDVRHFHKSQDPLLRRCRHSQSLKCVRRTQREDSGIIQNAQKCHLLTPGKGKGKNAHKVPKYNSCHLNEIEFVWSGLKKRRWGGGHQH